MMLGELRRWDTVSNDVDFAPAQAGELPRWDPAKFNCQLVEIGNALVKIFGVAVQDDALTGGPIR